MFGEEGLAELVAREGWRFPQHLLARIQEGVTAHTGAGALADDLTCVVVRIDDDPGEPLRQAGIAVDSRLESLARVRAFLRDLLADGPGGPVDDDGIDAIELAVDEAVSNVIKHALHGRPDRTIRVELAVFADRVRAQIVHDGQPLDPDLVAPPSFDGTRDNGFGVFLIDQAMDEVRYLRDPDGRSRVVLGRQRLRG
jgi:anti-sigma regulatory factor (Ser/Thr protein kinase)